jgi:hypothetical protein
MRAHVFGAEKCRKINSAISDWAKERIKTAVNVQDAQEVGKRTLLQG